MPDNSLLPHWLRLLDPELAVSGLALRAYACYQEPHRRYHDASHVLEMLEAAQAWYPLTLSQQLAVLFHDAVYVPGAKAGCNETLSAHLMRWHAAPSLPEAVVAEARSIILDTIHHRPSSDLSAPVLDLDLMRLAAPEAQFDAYTELLRQEIQPMLGEGGDFKLGRNRFFEGLLSRPHLFVTDVFRAKYESAARQNMSRILSSDR